MIIYNVTTSVHPTVQASWVKWMQQVHIPEVMATGCFTAVTLAKLIELDDAEQHTYCCQYTAPSLSIYHTYIATYSTALRNKSIAQWGNACLVFRTVMQTVSE